MLRMNFDEILSNNKINTVACYDGDDCMWYWWRPAVSFQLIWASFRSAELHYIGLYNVQRCCINQLVTQLYVLTTTP